MPHTPHIAFDDAGQPVGACGFHYPEDEPQDVDSEVLARAIQEARQEARQEAMAKLMAFLESGSRNPLVAGRRVHLLSHILWPQETQRVLAKRLGLTPGRVSQLLNATKRELASLMPERTCPAHSKLNAPAIVERCST